MSRKDELQRFAHISFLPVFASFTFAHRNNELLPDVRHGKLKI